MDTAHWPQDLGLVKPTEDLIMSSSTTSSSNNNNTYPITRPQPRQVMERRVRPQKEQALNCPRCNSTNTKFCYYNNYSLTQPRYFCKTCRRYWTEGGSLRNVPVGGGSRKNKRSSSSAPSSSSSSSASSTTSTSLPTPISSLSSSTATQNPKFQEGQDLNLAFPVLPEFGGASCTNINASTSAMELLRSGGINQGTGIIMNPFMPMSPMAMPEFTSGFNTLSFPLDGVNGGGGASGGVTYRMHESTGRLLFPFEEARPGAHGASDHFEHNKGQSGGGDPPGFWSGLMGGGGGGGGGGGAW